jgi:hypothetical protein
MAMKMFLEIISDGGQLEKDIKKVEECLKAAWNAFSNEFFEELIANMERRVKDCITAQGWHTKY